MPLKILGIVAVIVILAALSYGGWLVSRWWNYSWGYEDMVRETVCEMVKPEYLKKPCDE